MIYISAASPPRRYCGGFPTYTFEATATKIGFTLAYAVTKEYTQKVYAYTRPPLREVFTRMILLTVYPQMVPPTLDKVSLCNLCMQHRLSAPQFTYVLKTERSRQP